MAPLYNVSDRVEVMFPEAGFVGSFFLATVLLLLDDGHVYVQFHHLLTYSGFFFLRDIIEVVNIRPMPPFIGTVEYAVHDLVEVFVNDGWWLGRVIDIYVVDGYYEIHFEGYDEVSFNVFYEMHPHLVWEDNR
ncbi:protein AGENET DOMAIN (AGD)-CONTAINING P1-like [Silene latifolia]|uniref:protein AGENET DOMAIN (AGD)-CONTAINING P1-like n=1 Tax=Silene latifolia TaxID=37657 RepID=UPI003D7760DD